MGRAAWLFACLLLPVGPGHAAQERVDGIAAVVNDEIISVGQVRRAEKLLREDLNPILVPRCGRGPAVTGAGHALECLIDQLLVFREVRRFPQFDVDSNALDGLWQQVVAAYPDRADRAAELDRLSLTETELRADLRRQLQVAGYVDRRFRATVDVPRDTAREYFDAVIVPDMRAQGIDPPAFEQVVDDYVVPILREQEVNRRVESWIVDLRERATIQRRSP